MRNFSRIRNNRKLFLLAVMVNIAINSNGYVIAAEDYTREHTETYNDWYNFSLNPANESGIRDYNLPENTIIGWDGNPSFGATNHTPVIISAPFSYDNGHKRIYNSTINLNSPNTIKLIVRYPKDMRAMAGYKQVVHNPEVVHWDQNPPRSSSTIEYIWSGHEGEYGTRVARGMELYNSLNDQTDKDLVSNVNVNAPLWIDVAGNPNPYDKEEFSVPYTGINIRSNSNKTRKSEINLNLNKETEINVHNNFNALNTPLNEYYAVAAGISTTANDYYNNTLEDALFNLKAKDNVIINLDTKSDKRQNIGIYWYDKQTINPSTMKFQGKKLAINIQNINSTLSKGISITNKGRANQNFITSQDTEMTINNTTKNGDIYGISTKYLDRDPNGKIDIELMGKNHIKIETSGDYSNSDYGDAYGISLSNISGNQKMHFGDDTIIETINNQNGDGREALGIYTSSVDKGKLEFTSDKKLKITNKTGKIKNNVGISLNAYGNKQDASEQVINLNGETIIEGVYSGANVTTADGSKIALNFNGGLTLDANPLQEGATILMARGAGSVITINKLATMGNLKGGNVKLQGSIGAYYGGKTEINVVNKDSVADLVYYGNKSSEHKFAVLGEGSVLKAKRYPTDFEINGLVADKGVFKPDNYTLNNRIISFGMNNLELENYGTLDLSRDDNNEKKVVYVDKLTGNNGRVLLGIDASKNTDADLLVVGELEGTHKIALKELGKGNLKGAENTTLALVTNGDGKFIAEDGKGTLYYHRYELAKRSPVVKDYTRDIIAGANSKDEWYLKKAQKVNPWEKPTPEVTYLTGFSNYKLQNLYELNDTLRQRLGDLIHNDNVDNLWFRIANNRFSYNKVIDYDVKYEKYELGYDKLVKNNERLKRFRGGSLQRINADLKAGINSTSIINDISLYQVDVYKNGGYLDSILRYGYNKSKDKLYFPDSKLTIDQNKTWFWAGSIEYGRMLKAKNDYYVEPQAQLTYTRTSKDSFSIKSDDENYIGEVKGNKSLLGRLGMELGRNYQTNGTSKGRVYAKLNVFHEFLGDNVWWSRNIDDTEDYISYNSRNHGTWWKYGVGFTSEHHNNIIYGDVEKISGNNYKHGLQWNLGYRYRF